MNELSQQLKAVSSEGVVTDGKLVGEYDFYHYLSAMEGKKVKWSLEVIPEFTESV